MTAKPEIPRDESSNLSKQRESLSRAICHLWSVFAGVKDLPRTAGNDVHSVDLSSQGWTGGSALWQKLLPIADGTKKEDDSIQGCISYMLLFMSYCSLLQ